MFSKLFLGTQDDKYKVGQVWEYETRKGEEKSTLTIVAIERHKKLGTIINIYVGGLRMKNPNVKGGLSDKIPHLPFSKAAIDKSVTKLIRTSKELPDYQEGYDVWRKAFDNEEAGIFTISVKESVDLTEQTINHGTIGK